MAPIGPYSLYCPYWMCFEHSLTIHPPFCTPDEHPVDLGMQRMHQPKHFEDFEDAITFFEEPVLFELRPFEDEPSASGVRLYEQDYSWQYNKRRRVMMSTRQAEMQYGIAGFMQVG